MESANVEIKLTRELDTTLHEKQRNQYWCECSGRNCLCHEKLRITGSQPACALYVVHNV